MIALIAKKSVQYGPRKYRPGEVFQVRSRDDSKVLTALGFAAYLEKDQTPDAAPEPTAPAPAPEPTAPEPAPQPQPASDLQTEPIDDAPSPMPEPVFGEVRVVESGEPTQDEVSQEVVDAEDAPKRKRAYRRRDMKAE